jgi:hypothetical protein
MMAYLPHASAIIRSALEKHVMRVAGSAMIMQD